MATSWSRPRRGSSGAYYDLNVVATKPLPLRHTVSLTSHIEPQQPVVRRPGIGVRSPPAALRTEEVMSRMHRLTIIGMSPTLVGCGGPHRAGAHRRVRPGHVTVRRSGISRPGPDLRRPFRVSRTQEVQTNPPRTTVTYRGADRVCESRRPQQRHLLRRAPRAQLSGWRGEPKAIGATRHDILVAYYHIVRDQVPFRELGPAWQKRRYSPEHRARRLQRQLEKLGYKVTLEQGNGPNRPPDPTTTAGGLPWA
jgi:hypothetical protein